MKKIALVLVALFCTLSVLQAQTYNATVAKDGSGTHTTVAAAIASAPISGTTPYYIYVKSGLYNEKDTVPTNRPNVILVGQNVLNTVIYNNDNATTTLVNGNPIGTAGSSAFFVNGANFAAFNITFQNNAGVAATQAVAVNISGDKATFRNCRFLGFQDVLYCKNAGIASYFKNCYVEGTVDFIFGASTTMFDSCYIYCKNRQSGGVICAPNTAAGTSFGSPWGFVFNNCAINGASGMTSLYYLGRPWQNKPQAVYRNCSMSDVIINLGWSSASAGSATTADASFGEYNSTGTGANAGSRASFSSQLTASQDSTYTKSNIFGSWDVCSLSGVCDAVDKPIATANFTGSQATSTSSSFSWNMCWPVAMTYTIKRSNNGGSWTQVDNFTGSTSSYNYSSADNAMPSGVNRYILQMTSGGTTVTSTDTITISNQPTITTSGTMSAFAQTIGSPSGSQVISVSGANLTGNITLTAPTNFQISLNNASWASSQTITQSGGTVAATNVYFRLNAGSLGSYSGNDTITSSGAATIIVALSGTTSAVPAYVATLLQQWPLTVSGTDSAAVRAIGINAGNAPTLKRLIRPDGSVPATGTSLYSGVYGLISAPDSFILTSSKGLWTTAYNGNGNTLTRAGIYQEFTISGATGYSERIDSLILNCNFYNTSGKLAVVYSKSGFASDSTDITLGGTSAGTALGATAYGAFANPIALVTNTSGPATNFRLPLNGSTGVTLASGQTLTIRLYFSCGSSSAGRYLCVKNVQLKGSVTAPPPTVSSFTPTAQVAGGSVVITGTNFSGVTAVSFGGVAAASYTVNSGTQITAVVAAGGATGKVYVTTTNGQDSSAGFTFQVPTTFYNVANSDVTDVNSWGTNTDGSGTHPSSFTNILQTFQISNPGATMSGAWTVSGTNSKIVVADGSAVFNQTQPITGTINVTNNGDLEVKIATTPTLGTLSSGSTVGYSATSVAQTISAANYYNLTLSGSGTRTFPSGSVVGVANQFTTNSYTTAGTGSVVSFNGTSPQSIPPFTYDSLIINNTGGVITQGGGSAVVVNRGMSVLQNFTVDNGDLVQLTNTTGAAFSVASGAVLTVTGTLDNQSTGTVTLGSLSSSVSGSTAANVDSSRFVVNNGGIYKINAAVTNGYYLSVSTFKPGSELQVLQGSPRIPVYIGGNVTWNSTGVGTLIQQNTSTIGGNLTISAGQLNLGTGGTGRTLNVNGKLKLTGGEFEPGGSSNSSAQILNVYDSIIVSGGNLYPTLSVSGGTGTINAYGNVVKTSGNLDNAAGAIVGGVIAFVGSAPQVAPPFSSGIGLIINNASGVSFSSNITVGNVTLTNGIVNMNGNTLTTSANVSRSNGWVRGKLQKRLAAGTNVAATFELGDAANYLPVSLTFANVSTAGDVVASFSTPITAVPNYASAPVSGSAYINKYWTLGNVNTLAFNTYSATLSYTGGDLVGGANSGSVLGYVYGSNWSIKAPNVGSNANTLTNVSSLGNVILANACSPVTPSVTISTATTNVCSGNSVTFTANATNGGTSPSFQWSRNGVNTGSGTSTTFPANSLANGDTISCVLTANNNCQTTGTANSNNIVLTVRTSPTVGTSTGGTICTVGGTLTVYNSNTQGGGVWSSSNNAIATVSTSGGAVGNVTAVATGTDTLTYTKTAANGCMSSATSIVTIPQQGAIGTITSSNGNSICKGFTTNLGGVSGGTWSSPSSSIASVNNSGVVTGNSAGTATIYYKVTNSGCSGVATYNVTVNPTPGVPTIQYAAGTVNPQNGPGGSFCLNKAGVPNHFTVVGSPNSGNSTGSGSWSSSNNNVFTVTGGGGVITLVAPGTATVTYTYTSGAPQLCSNSRSVTFTVGNCSVARGIATAQSISNNSEFTMYPNPAKSIVNLQVNTLVGAGSIVVTDLYGKQVKTQSLSMGNNNIDVSNLAKGFYLVSIITSEGKTTKKLVVE